MPYRNEETLVRACIAKKRRAQFAFYEKYKGKMYAVCLRYARDTSQAQDFLQEGFAKAFMALRQYRFEVPVEHWLRRIIINACISELRRKKEPMDRSIPFEEVPISLEEEEETASFRADGLSAKTIISLVQNLPEGYRTIFNLYAIEGYQHDEIAEILNISQGTSRSQYARARKALMKAIQKQKIKCHE